MKSAHSFQSIVLATSLAALLAWPSIDIGSVSDVGKSLAASTGIVSSGQIDALLKAGGKLDQATNTLSDEQEYYLGRSVAATILRQYPLYRGDPALTNYLNQVGQALVAKSARPEIFGGFHFAILDTGQINALSAPGGTVFVSRGFLSIIPNEDALAGVLAHEIGHIVLGHGVKAISQGKVSEAAMILGKEAASSFGPSELTAVTEVFGDSVNQVCDTIMKSGYSRSQEYEADGFAARLMAKAGYDAKGLSTMLDQIAQAGASSRGGWMDTHPSPADRKGELVLPKQSGSAEGLTIRTERYQKIRHKLGSVQRTDH